MVVAKWVHKGCGGEVGTHTVKSDFGVTVIARCNKCGKEWNLGQAYMFLGIPILSPNLFIDDLEHLKGESRGIELNIWAYEDCDGNCAWGGELIVDGKEYDISVLYDLLNDEVIVNRIRGIPKEREEDGD